MPSARAAQGREGLGAVGRVWCRYNEERTHVELHYQWVRDV